MQPAYKPNIIKQVVEIARSIIRDPGQVVKQKQKRICSCCGYAGAFISMRKNLPEKRCPNCASRPRDRLLAHALMQYNIDFKNKRILHFSPEPNLFGRLKKEPGYISGDIKKSRYARYRIDVIRIPYPDHYFDVLICNHVMEHVDDHIAGFKECYRVLKSGGSAFFSVPYYPDRLQTWYPPPTMPKEEIERICGWDHKRMYGRDFADMVAGCGFRVEMYLPNNDEMETIYQTTSNDPIFIARKPD